MNSPIFCHQNAYSSLQALRPALEKEQSLIEAAAAISMHEFPHLDPQSIEQKLQYHADAVRCRFQGDSPRAALAHLHEYLFEEQGFSGDTEDYYLPKNSYIHRVLETKKGLPITLSLIYYDIARRLGIQVHGIGSPGHFQVQVQIDHRITLIDPFHGGKMLTRLEAHAKAEQATGQVLPKTDAIFPRVSHIAWISRMILNLEHAFTLQGRENDVMAMMELKHLLIQDEH